jgi:hypothetical protein
MSVPKFRSAADLGNSARWECDDDECDGWGGHGGATPAANLRRTKADGREHREETGHPVTVLVVAGWYEGESDAD